MDSRLPIRPPPLAIKEKDVKGMAAKEDTDAKKQLAPYFTIFLENPDGSLSLGLPPDMKLPSPPPSPRQERRTELLSDVPLGMLEAGASSAVYTGSVDAFKRHEQFFSGLLLLEMVVEVVYLLMLYHGARHSIQAVAAAYQVLPKESLWMLFWIQLACEISYLKLYFCMGFSALMKHKPRLYSYFSNVALGGIVVQVLFAYMNKANIAVFALRLISYVYSRFLRGMLQHIMLHPLSMEV
eukprot:TRINITY_DN21280_c0_g1_i1.p1 TRINITY_DN21280_c0_g1~~TRINITY_DN21280_c0_g1_i1.p1  ORF type:complete len:239 (+),score=55.34 TRINITY_DN21280_c0_g1_i1:111-827(+)